MHFEDAEAKSEVFFFFFQFSSGLISRTFKEVFIFIVMEKVVVLTNRSKGIRTENSYCSNM